MKRLRLPIAVIVTALVSFWYSIAKPEVLYRYRWTVEINTPTGVKSGSSVIETRLLENPGWLPDVGVAGTRVFGEAVFVDLGSGKNVIAILAKGSTGQADVDFCELVPSALGIRGCGGVAAMRPALAKAGSKIWPVPREATPTIVTFTDLNDPLTAKVVFASQYGSLSAIDAFAEILGQGYGLNNSTVEIVPSGLWPLNQIPLPFANPVTGTPVTKRIEGRILRLSDVNSWNRPLNELPWKADRFLAGSGAFKREL
jgi:hypothetical protein